MSVKDSPVGAQVGAGVNVDLEVAAFHVARQRDFGFARQRVAFGDRHAFGRVASEFHAVILDAINPATTFREHLDATREHVARHRVA